MRKETFSFSPDLVGEKKALINRVNRLKLFIRPIRSMLRKRNYNKTT